MPASVAPAEHFIVSCPHCRSVIHWLDDEQAHRDYLENLKPQTPALLIPPVYVGKWGAPPQKKGVGSGPAFRALQRRHEHLGESKVFPMKCPNEECAKVIVAMLGMSNEAEILAFYQQSQHFPGRDPPEIRWGWVALTAAQFVELLNAETNPIVRGSVKAKLWAAGWMFGGVEAEGFPRAPPRRSSSAEPGSEPSR